MAAAEIDGMHQQSGHDNVSEQGRRAATWGRATSAIGNTSAMPKTKRNVRNVNGGAYCNPTLVAR